MRLLLGLALAGLASLSGCDCLNHVEVKATFINGTDTLLCDHYFAWGANKSGRIPDELGCAGGAGETVKPHERRTRLPGCGYYGPDEAFNLTIVLTVFSDGRVIYNRTASCKEWNDANATFIIKQRGDDFVVTDSLPR
jgi:hypothetical protein